MAEMRHSMRLNTANHTTICIISRHELKVTYEGKCNTDDHCSP